jgi:UDP-glucose 4-epimerase
MTARSAIVFGGGGFIGTNLCRRLVSSGFDVRAFGHRCQFPNALGDVEWITGDLADTSAVTRALKPGSIVFHLIHNILPHAAQETADISHDIAPTLRLIDACRNIGTMRVVFVSSGGTVYGKALQIPTPEDTPTNPITPYARSNLAIEQCLALQHQLNGLDYRVLRVTNPYGPFQTANKGQGVIAALIKRALLDENIDIWGDGSIVRDFVYIDDLVNALLLAADDSSAHRVYNIGSGQGRSLLDVVAIVERSLGNPLRIRWQPGRPSDIPASVVSISRANEALRWQPKVAFIDGIQRTVTWWREHLSAALTLR